LVCAALVLLGLCGCVQRRITIRSNPPGALVYVDKYEIGKTPCSVAYTYYGTREIRLVRDGYETLTLMQWIPPPWYQIPPLDFVSENIVPAEIRAENLRRATQLEHLAAPPPAPRPRPAAVVPTSPPANGNLPPPGGPPPGYVPGPGPNIYPGPGVYFPPGNYAPPGNWMPGYPSPGYLPAPGPSPPRGPQ
jgi:hypothetical protein